MCETAILGASSLAVATGSLDASELMRVLLLLVVFFGGVPMLLPLLLCSNIVIITAWRFSCHSDVVVVV